MRDETSRPPSPGERFDALADPVVRAAVDQALERYRDLVSPEVLEEMRESLADFLVMHPATNRLVRSLQPRTNVASGAERVGAGPGDEEAAIDGSGRKVG